MSSRPNGARKSRRIQEVVSRVRGPSTNQPWPNAGTQHEPSAATTIAAATGGGRRTTPCPSVASTANTLVSHGRPTNATAASNNPCRPSHHAQRSREGLMLNAMTGADAFDEGSGGPIGVLTDTYKVGVQRGIGEVENGLEAGDFGVAKIGSGFIEERPEEGVELAQTAATTPAQSRNLRLGVGHISKSPAERLAPLPPGAPAACADPFETLGARAAICSCNCCTSAIHGGRMAPREPTGTYLRRFRKGPHTQPVRLAQATILETALDDHLLDFGDGLARVQVFRARLRAIQDRVAAIEPEGVL